MPLSRIPATFLSGQVPDANIAAVAASKLTGQVPDANAPSGSVIQVVSAFSFGSNSGGSGVWVASPVSASITPTLASSKILVRFDLPNIYCSAAPDMYLRILANGTSVTPQRDDGQRWSNTRNIAANRQQCSIDMLHSPNTTSAQTYTCEGYITGTTLYMNFPSDRGIHTVVLMEIAA